MPELVAGVPVELSPVLRRVLAPNPNIMTGPGTNTYLVGDEAIAVIDPGPADDAHLDAVAAAGDGRIRWILATHTHSDHSPGAVGLKERTGAEVIGFGPMRGKAIEQVDDTFAPDVRAGEGWRLAIPKAPDLVALHTPGHASNHLCFLLDAPGGAGDHDGRWLFSGDHIMNGSTVVIAPDDGDMAEYLASLERLRDLPMHAIAPGHGDVIDDPYAKIEEYVAHRLAREAEVLATLGRLQADPSGAPDVTVSALVDAIYTGVKPELHPVARYSVWAHLRKLAGEGHVSSSDVNDLDATWVTARPPGMA